MRKKILNQIQKKLVDHLYDPQTELNFKNYTDHDIRLLKRILKNLKPPDNLSISQWAERYRILINSANSGKWSNTHLPFQKEPMDEILNPQVETIVLMLAAQIGKTEIGINALFYFMHQDPSPMILALPNDRAAKEFSKKRLNPEMDATREIKALMKDSKKTNNTLNLKKFQGGFLKIIGTNVASNLASDPARVVYCDEIDRFEKDIQGEGDPIKLLKKRTTTFQNRKMILTSTPTEEENSLIESFFNRSDKRYYHVPCPFCNHFQALEWKNFQYVQYSDENYEDYKELYFKCINGKCKKKITEAYKKSMVKKGKWIKTNPQVKKTAGFHINEFYAERNWAEIIKDYLESDDIEKKKTFYNLSLGLPYADTEAKVRFEDLYKRRENYKIQEVPPRVKFLICGADIQQRYVEYVVKGYLENQESYVIDYGTIFKKKGLEEMLEELEEHLFNKTYYGLRDKSKKFKIARLVVDTGHWSKAIYSWHNDSPNKRRTILIKGKATYEKSLSEPREIDTIYNNRKLRAKLHIIGTNNMKDFIYKNLEKMPPHKDYKSYIDESDIFPKGFIHFPKSLNQDFFRSLTSERKIKEVVGDNFRYKWKIGSYRRNEVLDCFVYADAVALSLKWNSMKIDRMHFINEKSLNNTSELKDNSVVISNDAFGSSSYFDL